jgi:hypothetical protein
MLIAVVFCVSALTRFQMHWYINIGDDIRSDQKIKIHSSDQLQKTTTLLILSSPIIFTNAQICKNSLTDLFSHSTKS